MTFVAHKPSRDACNCPTKSPDTTTLYCESKQWRRFLVECYESVWRKEGSWLEKQGPGSRKSLFIVDFTRSHTIKLKSTGGDSKSTPLANINAQLKTLSPLSIAASWRRQKPKVCASGQTTNSMFFLFFTTNVGRRSSLYHTNLLCDPESTWKIQYLLWIL